MGELVVEEKALLNLGEKSYHSKVDEIAVRWRLRAREYEALRGSDSRREMQKYLPIQADVLAMELTRVPLNDDGGRMRF